MNRLYLLPQPPACMPLYIPSCGRSGYCFYPLSVPEECSFELVVQGKGSKWCYLGTYIISSLPEHPMALSEWMILDDQTKKSHCARLTARHFDNNHPPMSADLVKEHYDSGRWKIPCFVLRCVGFDKELCHTINTTVHQIHALAIHQTHDSR
ncbi:hypothetical protein E4T56_gene12899 [Termitomyces sp. T112]|nr:hypothetical protein E4T56_gene12899 [Termitomyces sp. T112]